MTLSRHLETLARHVQAGNIESAKRQAESLLRMYGRASDQKKILETLNA
jgi:hypothetical protein